MTHANDTPDKGCMVRRQISGGPITKQEKPTPQTAFAYPITSSIVLIFSIAAGEYVLAAKVVNKLNGREGRGVVTEGSEPTTHFIETPTAYIPLTFGGIHVFKKTGELARDAVIPKLFCTVRLAPNVWAADSLASPPSPTAPQHIERRLGVILQDLRLQAGGFLPQLLALGRLVPFFTEKRLHHGDVKHRL